MKLYELHVLYPALCTISHSYTVAGGYTGIGGGAVHLPCPTRCHKRAAGKYLFNIIGLEIKGVHAITSDVWRRLSDEIAQVMLGDDIHHKPVIVYLYIRVSLCFRYQRPFYLNACYILVVQY